MKLNHPPLKILIKIGQRGPVHSTRGAHSAFASAARYSLSLLSMAFMLAICNPSQAQAQGSSVILRQGQLQQAGWHKTPLELQILDERPRVKDLRTPEPAPEQYIVPIPPMPTAQGQTNSVGSGVRMVPNNLPQAGFGQSNIPAHGMAPARSLPTTKSGGLSPVERVRPIGLTAPQGSQQQLSVAGRIPSKPAQVASYPNDSRQDRGLLTGYSASDKTAKRYVHATLMGGR